MLTRRKVYLSKVESTKGTDSVPVVASDLILPNGDLNIAIPTEQDSGEGDLKGTYGPGDSVTTKQSMSLEISTRVRGLGQGVTAKVTPDIHPWLLASGHTVTTAGDGTSTARSAEYKPSSVEANLKSSSDYLYEDGLLYKLLGTVGPISFEASMNALMAKSTRQAKYTAPTVVALPTWAAPTPKIFRMTSALCAVTEGGDAVNIGAFTFDPGTDVQEANETGNLEFMVANRNPVISIDPRAVATAADWLALTNATSLAIIATFTNELGETLVFNAPKAVPSEIAPGDRAGRITRAKKFSLKETAGDDQYTIKWTSVL
jgi:hypothetical protein